MALKMTLVRQLSQTPEYNCYGWHEDHSVHKMVCAMFKCA